mgnify:CR=1 FL=1
MATTPRDVVRAYKKTVAQTEWFALRARPWRERFAKYPLRTVWCAVVDRFWFTVIAITKNPLVKTKTFWGQSITVRFDENRPIVHDGLIDSKELGLTAFIVKNVSDRDIFFDIGANVGFYTLLSSALGAQVHAFEPSPETFHILEKNATSVTLVNKALMDNEGSIQFADLGAGAGLSTAMFEKDASNIITVKATTLDAYCKKHVIVPTMLKIDAENAEQYVIDGGLQTIQTYHPTLVVEGNERIIERLQPMGYDVFQLNQDGETIPYHQGDFIFNDNLLFRARV